MFLALTLTVSGGFVYIWLGRLKIFTYHHSNLITINQKSMLIDDYE